MNYPDYVERLRRHASHAELFEYGAVQENGRSYPLFRLTVPGPRWLVITAGFHGEEPAGPLTLLEHFPEIAQAARDQGVGLRVYPCINPSGFEAGTRYNASGERPNNDLLRYETAPGLWKGEIDEGETFLRYALYDGGPKETQAIRNELVKHAPPIAALDIHQDDYLPEPLTYAYVFGDKEAYRPLMRASAPFATVAQDYQVDEHRHTDPDGLIVFHDGSVTDYFARAGVPYTATLETTTRTPMERCHAINLAWIHGFIRLATQG